MLSRCMHLTRPLCKLVDELGLEGPSENDWSTAELLCHFMKPFQTVKDYLQGEKYPTLGSLSRKLTHATNSVFQQAKTTTILVLE